MLADAATVVSAVWPRLPGAVEKVVFVSVDPDNAIAEFSENDNAAFLVLTVLSLPDLAIDPADIRLTPGFPARGETVQIEVRITNLGVQAATDVVVQAFAGDPATEGVQISAEQRLSVAGGGTAVAQFTWTLSGTAEEWLVRPYSAGTCTICAVAAHAMSTLHTAGFAVISRACHGSRTCCPL